MIYRNSNAVPKTVLALVAAAALWSGAARAAEQDTAQEFKDGAKNVGETIGSVFREIGHGTRDFFRAIGHGTRDAVKTIGAVASEGGNGFKRGITGETQPEQPTPPAEPAQK